MSLGGREGRRCTKPGLGLTKTGNVGRVSILQQSINNFDFYCVIFVQPDGKRRPLVHHATGANFSIAFRPIMIICNVSAIASSVCDRQVTGDTSKGNTSKKNWPDYEKVYSGKRQRSRRHQSK